MVVKVSKMELFGKKYINLGKVTYYLLRKTGKTDKLRSMSNEKRICLSITAHVDAGKTTLAEAMLYEAGQLKTRGRVDHRNSALDHEDFERERGITAFSKQAVFRYGKTCFSLIDTPGHTELFAETERSLRVPDTAVLVISGSEGIQADTGNIWKLLRENRIPTWIFVSKMDLPACDRTRILKDMKERLSDSVTDFALSDQKLNEEIAGLNDLCMEEYLDTGTLSDSAVRRAIAEETVFPCFFGSGLRLEGVKEFLTALDRWTEMPDWPSAFSAICYKISRDTRGQRMTQVKLTGGSLSVRNPVHYRNSRGELQEEKVTGIRIYTGSRFESAETVMAGEICSLLGLSETRAGCVLGNQNAEIQTPEPAIRRCRLRFEPPQDTVRVMGLLRQLEEELPELRPESEKNKVSVCLAGRMQEDLLKALLLERFGLHAHTEQGMVVYKETVGKRVEGIGHFEPLRHYAEVHLILEPLPPGSGLIIESNCPEDRLDRNWQNLILECLRNTRLKGVLVGAELTDARISLVSGRAHLKHTEGGDFREATLRALRQGLMQAECRLLEPICSFQLELPAEQLGRAISDLKTMYAELEIPATDGLTSRISGRVPASEIGDYTEALKAYTHGHGKLFLRPAGYQYCHNEQRVLETSDYEAERDTDWPADSVFCSHGAGHTVSWREVPDYMHLPSALEETAENTTFSSTHHLQRIDDRELEEIMLREFGPIKRPMLTIHERKLQEASETAFPAPFGHTLIVDGYNFIFAEPELRKLAAVSMDGARSSLMDRLSNYAGFTGQEMVVVFDGYRSSGNPGLKGFHANIHVIFTAEGESADAFIEKLTAEIGKNEKVSVVTGDTMIRISAMRSGVLRITPKEFGMELLEKEKQLHELMVRSNFLAHSSHLGETGNIKTCES